MSPRSEVQLVARIVERLREHANSIVRETPDSRDAAHDATTVDQCATMIETEFGGEGETVSDTRKSYTPPQLTQLTPAETIARLEAECARLEKELAAERERIADVEVLIGKIQNALSLRGEP